MTAARRRIIIAGAGGHGAAVADLIRATGLFDIAGFVDPSRSDAVSGITILGGDEVLEALRGSGVDSAALGIGDNAARTKVGQNLLAKGFLLPALIHPSAVVSSSAYIGVGTIVMALAAVNAEAHVEDYCILNTGAIVEHHCTIGPGTHIAPGSVVAGHVSIGEQVLLGAGSAIRPGISIGANAVVGLGSSVVNDVPQGITVVGVPASQLQNAMSGNVRSSVSGNRA